MMYSYEFYLLSWLRVGISVFRKKIPHLSSRFYSKTLYGVLCLSHFFFFLCTAALSRRPPSCWRL